MQQVPAENEPVETGQSERDERSMTGYELIHGVLPGEMVASFSTTVVAEERRRFIVRRRGHAHQERIIQ